MTAQTALSTFAAFLGFAASVFFVLGAIRLDARLIYELASPRWDFHIEIARYLVGQRAEYTCGAVLLLVAFVAQAVSIAPFSFNQTVFVSTAEVGFIVVGVVGVVLWLVSVAVYRYHSRAIIAVVEQLAQQAREREEQQLKQRHNAP